MEFREEGRHAVAANPDAAAPGDPSGGLPAALSQLGLPGAGQPRPAFRPLDPNSPEGKTAIATMRQALQSSGKPPAEIDRLVNDAVQHAQQPLPAPPSPEPPIKQPPPGLGEQLGQAFNDFTNNVHAGFYDRADQTLNTIENLTGTGGEGHPGVAGSWKQLIVDNATHALTDPASTLGPANPLSALSGAAHELPEAIDNPGHYAAGKLVDTAVAGATLPFGGEGAALSRTFLPELGALKGDVIPGMGAVTHDVTPGIAHNVVDVPPGVEHPAGGPLGGSHDLPALADHPLPASGGSPGHVPFHFDANADLGYSSGNPHLPGDWPPHTPEPTWTKGDTDPGWQHINRGPDKPWMDYQAQITGIERTPDGHIPEFTVANPETGSGVNFDGHTYRGD